MSVGTLTARNTARAVLLATGLAAGGGTGEQMALPLVKYFEGLRLQAYLDPVGIPTICYGSTSGVTLGMTKTQEACDALLAHELGSAFRTVDALVRVPMPETRRAALASFVYNVGAGAFAKSTALKKINAGDAAGGCNALVARSFNKAGKCVGYGCGWSSGEMLPALQARRAGERAICLVDGPVPVTLQGEGV